MLNNMGIVMVNIDNIAGPIKISQVGIAAHKHRGSTQNVTWHL